MPRISKNQIYGRVERKLWRNKIFRDTLSDDARLMWLYMLTTFREAHLPGLVEATVLNMMEDLGWHERGIEPDSEAHEGIAIGAKRTQLALSELLNVSWVEYSKSDRLLVMSRAVLHNLPANEDVVNKWVKTLAEFPDTVTKRHWIKSAVSTLKRSYGKNDHRFKRLNTYWLGTCQHPPFDTEQSGIVDDLDSVCTPCEPDLQGNSPEVSQRLEHRVVATNTNTNTNTSTKHKHEEEEERGGGAVPPTAPRTPQKAKPSLKLDNDAEKKPGKRRALPPPEKPDEPPSDFSNRQSAFYRALQETEFYVRGQKEDRTAFAIVKDPVRLAKMLGKHDTFPMVDVGLIGRLGAWSYANKAKSKVDINRFILNRARYTQENPPRGQNGQNDGVGGGSSALTGRRKYGDLHSKTMNRSSGN